MREVFGKAIGIDGGRGDDDFQIRAARQQVFQITEQKINVEAAFVRLVDDDGVVLAEVAVGLGFGQHDAVCHQLDVAFRTGFVVKTHFVTHGLTDVAAQFFGDALCNCTCGQTARLGVAD